MTRLFALIAVALASVVATAATTMPPAEVGVAPTRPPLAPHWPAWLLLVLILGLLAAAAVHTYRATRDIPPPSSLTAQPRNYDDLADWLNARPSEKDDQL